MKAKVACNNILTRILTRWESASSMFVNNAIDIFNVLMRKNIHGLNKRVLNINNDLIKVMYNCTAVVNCPVRSIAEQNLCTL